MEKRAVFPHRVLPYVLLAPQIAVTLVFFVWPASQALYQSLLRQDAFGLRTSFAGLENFAALFRDRDYLHAVAVTAIFSASVTALALSSALVLAVMADRVVRGGRVYRTLLVWPYAVAPAVAGVLWLFLFNPTLGIVAFALRQVGYRWNHLLNGDQAMVLVVLAAAWKQVSYNFIFFLAGLAGVGRAVLEAAAIDGAGPARRFVSIVFPLLSPTMFFLVVVNIVYAFFETFGIVHAVTGGGPARATEILVFKVFRDGFVGLDLGRSAAQSVILMAIVIGLTVVQFRYVERKVHY
ncbi:MAG: glycerol-3-phosphate transporter permease [Candidatus Rokubacteria bacterium 13_1_20CM_2_68_19]|nr:MAG: glycerol-3-phosphate transporter permease [Candidatus Rokubacteria bacterium 13_2_20CM_69_10]OLB41142.1 MAG: glycerol-3-phosphate transporter permease [Candidatus Rokubacteria bacterium 13_2_20CM_2_64_8]OLD30930.1 MAG: glycerol-3-phosphate transporter permease [Candidatus Rokubacteria bacterium 13_1_40CM_2_68_13]OLE44423.1 MAG: glycerol-3-phosphate transporter permease [Candidatus Rokubacteria bacterium 13_1_20CM_2_68_19]PYN65375.1 MAG: sn-glycerol-3-phosphate ABC transporter permease U